MTGEGEIKFELLVPFWHEALQLLAPEPHFSDVDEHLMYH